MPVRELIALKISRRLFLGPGGLETQPSTHYAQPTDERPRADMVRPTPLGLVRSTQQSRQDSRQRRHVPSDSVGEALAPSVNVCSPPDALTSDPQLLGPWTLTGRGSAPEDGCRETDICGVDRGAGNEASSGSRRRHRRDDGRQQAALPAAPRRMANHRGRPRQTLAAECAAPRYLFSASEMLDHPTDLAAQSATLTRVNERPWRVFHQRVEQITLA
jgi:hypothetical protein